LIVDQQRVHLRAIRQLAQQRAELRVDLAQLLALQVEVDRLLLLVEVLTSFSAPSRFQLVENPAICDAVSAKLAAHRGSDRGCDHHIKLGAAGQVPGSFQLVRLKSSAIALKYDWRPWLALLRRCRLGRCRALRRRRLSRLRNSL
jgi:hypothetical protein